MSRIAVVGAGVWGTAVTDPLEAVAGCQAAFLAVPSLFLLEP